MKKVIYILAMLQVSSMLFAQEFSTKLYLEAANGEKDMLEIGYDPNATHGIDPDFGEINFDSPISLEKFQVFIVNHRVVWGTTFPEYLYGEKSYYLKKEIIDKRAEFIEGNAIAIAVPYESSPVTVSWDSDKFNDPKHNYSIITDWPLGSWFDCGGCTFKHYMSEINKIVIENCNTNFSYKKDEETFRFRLFYVAFGNKENLAVDKTEKMKEAVSFYPNPVVDFCHIEKGRVENFEQIRIFSVSGNKVMSEKGDVPVIDCRNLTSGAYIAEITTAGNEKHYCKLIKR